MQQAVTSRAFCFLKAFLFSESPLLSEDFPLPKAPPLSESSFTSRGLFCFLKTLCIPRRLFGSLQNHCFSSRARFLGALYKDPSMPCTRALLKNCLCDAGRARERFRFFPKAPRRKKQRPNVQSAKPRGKTSPALILLRPRPTFSDLFEKAQSGVSSSGEAAFFCIHISFI